jgi:hypothetical protein
MICRGESLTCVDLLTISVNLETVVLRKGCAERPPPLRFREPFTDWW